MIPSDRGLRQRIWMAAIHMDVPKREEVLRTKEKVAFLSSVADCLRALSREWHSSVEACREAATDSKTPQSWIGMAVQQLDYEEACLALAERWEMFIALGVIDDLYGNPAALD